MDFKFPVQDSFPLEVYNARTFVSASGYQLYTYESGKCDNRVHDGWQLCVVPHVLEAFIYL